MNRIKTTSIIILLGILLSHLLNSCTANINHANGNFVEKSFPVEKFSRIKLEGGYNVELSQGDSLAIKVETSKKMLEKIEVWMDGDQLRIKTNLKNVSTDEIKLYITFNSITELKIEGGVNLYTKGTLEFNKFEMQVQGGANIDMDLTAAEFRAKGEGGVNMDLRGTVDSFYASTEGAGNIDADHLMARYVNCRVMGVGNASVYATDELHAHLEGVGKIGYRGTPEVYKEVNGIGFVYRK